MSTGSEKDCALVSDTAASARYENNFPFFHAKSMLFPKYTQISIFLPIYAVTLGRFLYTKPYALDETGVSPGAHSVTVSLLDPGIVLQEIRIL